MSGESLEKTSQSPVEPSKSVTLARPNLGLLNRDCRRDISAIVPSPSLSRADPVGFPSWDVDQESGDSRNFGQSIKAGVKAVQIFDTTSLHEDVGCNVANRESLSKAPVLPEQSLGILKNRLVDEENRGVLF